MKIVTGYTGEKHITSADDQGFNAGIVGNGLYVLPIGSQFALTYSGTIVTISDGEGVLQGVHFRASSETLTVSNPSSGYRCTVIYVRYTKTDGVESIGLYTKAGSTASSESAVVVPTVTSGNIRNGATRAEAVLFRVYSSTSGIYKTEMAADVVSSLASLTSGVSALNSKMTINGIYRLADSASLKPLSLTVPNASRHVLILTGPYISQGHGVYTVSCNASGNVYGFRIGGGDDMPEKISGTGNSLSLTSTSESDRLVTVADVVISGAQMTIAS